MVRYTEVVEYQELEDHQLIHWIALAEKEALEALYGRYSSSVFSLAMYMLKQEALAEEVTQDIFLNIWLKASSYKSDRGAPRAWIMSVAHHKIVDVIRSRRRTLTVTDPSLYETLDLIPSSEVPVDEQVVRNLERERILKALSTLPQPQRQVIMLAYFGGYSSLRWRKCYNSRWERSKLG